MTNPATKPYANTTPMKDRLDALFNDRDVLRRKDTFASRTDAELDLENSGRFAKPQQVVGSAPVPEYPRQPEGSFSNQAAVVPSEESLGFSVEETPIVGETQEVAASLERTAQEVSAIPTDDEPVRGAAGSEAETSSDVEPPPTPNTKPKEKPTMKPLAQAYVEPTEAEWRTRFLFPAMLRKDRLENEKLTIEKLIEESERQLLEAFGYFLCLTPEQQEQTAQQFKDGLERVKALLENNRERARQMLAKQGVRNV